MLRYTCPSNLLVLLKDPDRIWPLASVILAKQRHSNMHISTFVALPAEVRLLIYDFVGSKRQIQVQQTEAGGSNGFTDLLSLGQINRQVRDEIFQHCFEKRLCVPRSLLLGFTTHFADTICRIIKQLQIAEFPFQWELESELMWFHPRRDWEPTADVSLNPTVRCVNLRYWFYGTRIGRDGLLIECFEHVRRWTDINDVVFPDDALADGEVRIFDSDCRVIRQQLLPLERFLEIMD